MHHPPSPRPCPPRAPRTAPGRRVSSRTMGQKRSKGISSDAAMLTVCTFMLGCTAASLLALPPLSFSGAAPLLHFAMRSLNGKSWDLILLEGWSYLD